VGGRRLDIGLLKKVAKKTSKKLKYLREQVSKKANRLGITSEAALILLARDHGIGTATYLRKQSSGVQEQVRSSLPVAFAKSLLTRHAGNVRRAATRGRRGNVRIVIDYLIQDQELHDRCKDLLTARGKFDRAVREATTVFDDRLKSISGIRKMRPADLVGKALNPDLQRAVIVVSADPAEQQGFFSVCHGLVLAFRDPSHHKLSDKFTREDALKFCGFIDTILSALGKAKVHPERT
jgi:hypothetical protein